MEPIDLQTVIVRGVDASNQVSNEANQSILIQHHLSLRQAEQIRRDANRVKTSEQAEQKEVRSSTEGGGQPFYGGGRKNAERRRKNVLDDFRGRILDVRL